LIVTLSPEAHHKALDLTRTIAADVEYWPTPDPTGTEGSREQRLEAYRAVRDMLLARIKERFGSAPVGNEGEIASWPGIAVRRTASLRSPMSRPSTSFVYCDKEDVDARHKAGHDEGGFAAPVVNPFRIRYVPRSSPFQHTHDDRPSQTRARLRLAAPA